MSIAEKKVIINVNFMCSACLLSFDVEFDISPDGLSVSSELAHSMMAEFLFH